MVLACSSGMSVFVLKWLRESGRVLLPIPLALLLPYPKSLAFFRPPLLGKNSLLHSWIGYWRVIAPCLCIRLLLQYRITPPGWFLEGIWGSRDISIFLFSSHFRWIQVLAEVFPWSPGSSRLRIAPLGAWSAICSYCSGLAHKSG